MSAADGTPHHRRARAHPAAHAHPAGQAGRGHRHRAQPYPTQAHETLRYEPRDLWPLKNQQVQLFREISREMCGKPVFNSPNAFVLSNSETVSFAAPVPAICAMAPRRSGLWRLHDVPSTKAGLTRISQRDSRARELRPKVAKDRPAILRAGDGCGVRSLLGSGVRHFVFP